MLRIALICALCAYVLYTLHTYIRNASCKTRVSVGVADEFARLHGTSRVLHALYVCNCAAQYVYSGICRTNIFVCTHEWKNRCIDFWLDCKIIDLHKKSKQSKTDRRLHVRKASGRAESSRWWSRAQATRNETETQREHEHVAVAVTVTVTVSLRLVPCASGAARQFPLCSRSDATATRAAMNRVANATHSNAQS